MHNVIRFLFEMKYLYKYIVESNANNLFKKKIKSLSQHGGHHGLVWSKIIRYTFKYIYVSVCKLKENKWDGVFKIVFFMLNVW